MQQAHSTLRSAFSHITNSEVSDSQWLQASLPVKEGGIGIRRAASLALLAFLASAASTASLQNSILVPTPCPSDMVVILRLFDPS